MPRLFVLFCILLDFSLICNANALEFLAKPTVTEIYPESPLGVSLTVRLDEKEQFKIRSVSTYDEKIRFSVLLPEGRVVQTSRVWESRSRVNPRNTGQFEFDDPDKKEADAILAFNKWCTTNLAPGQYKVVCEIESVGILGVGESRIYGRELTPPVRLEFPLKVLERDDAAVNTQYEKLIAIAAKDVQNFEEREARMRAVELIVYSHEPLAIPYQLRMLRGEIPLGQLAVNASNLADIATYFVEADDIDAAGGLVSILYELEFEEKAMEPWRRQIYLDHVLWAIHELHEGEKPDVVKVTEDVVNTYPKPRDPRPIPGLD